jgi:predicted transcriptional regulator
MTKTATITIRVSPETKTKLGKLAKDTRRKSSALAAEALSAYVERELAIVADVKRGLDDVKTGRVVPHEQVVAEAREIIAEARRR